MIKREASSLTSIDILTARTLKMILPMAQIQKISNDLTLIEFTLLLFKLMCNKNSFILLNTNIIKINSKYMISPVSKYFQK